MAMTISNVCFLGKLSCMGCCGRDYTSKKDIVEAIRKNTFEFEDSKSPEEFRDRIDSKYLRDCGVCRNLIFSDKSAKSVKCPLHPAFNKAKDGSDLREGHCEIEYLCKAAFLFDLWDERKQIAFVKFIENKKLNWFNYSMGMNDDSFVDEFERVFDYPE